MDGKIKKIRRDGRFDLRSLFTLGRPATDEETWAALSHKKEITMEDENGTVYSHPYGPSYLLRKELVHVLRNKTHELPDGPQKDFFTKEYEKLNDKVLERSMKELGFQAKKMNDSFERDFKRKMAEHIVNRLNKLCDLDRDLISLLSSKNDGHIRIPVQENMLNEKNLMVRMEAGENGHEYHITILSLLNSFFEPNSKGFFPIAMCYSEEGAFVGFGINPID